MAEPTEVSNRSAPTRKRHAYVPVLLTLHDLFGIAAGLAFAYWVRFHSGVFEVEAGSYDPTEYLRVWPIAAGVWLASLAFVHLYRRNEKIWSWRVARRLIRGSLLAVALFVTILYFARTLVVHGLARWTFPMAFASVLGLVSLGRWLLHRRLRFTARALVLGAGPSGKEIARALRRHPELGWQVTGFVSADAEDLGRRLTGIEVIGAIEELDDLLVREQVEAVFVAQSDFPHRLLSDVFFACDKSLVDVKVMPDLSGILFSEVDVEEADGLPLLGLRETPLQGWNAALKRGFDAAVSALVLAAVSPLIACIAWAIRRDSPGPAFYRQERVGADGRHFGIIKFRTMRTDAEQRTGPVFSTPDDPRQTRVGRWLRQLHLDEIPQLWNVLRGDMSLVGPRPERPYFVERFREQIPRYMARHRIKSGMTGWAQVNGQTGHEGSIEERLRYDLYYIENWSLLFDLKVLAMTFVWVGRRMRQMRTLPEGHPALRRPEEWEVDGDEAEQSEGGRT